MSGFSLTTLDDFDVISTYCVPQQHVRAYSSKNVYVLGAFMPKQNVTTKFSVTGQVNTPGLTLSVQLYEIDENGNGSPIGGLVSIVEQESVRRLLAQPVTLVANRQYQFRAWCIGSNAAEAFGVLNSALLEVA